MANKLDNLKPKDSNQNREEAKINGRKGGIASGEARRRKKEIKMCLDALLEKEITSRTGEAMSGAEAISLKLFEKALKGDVRAFEVLRDSAGQKPTEKIAVSTLNEDSINKLQNAIKKRRKK